MKKETLQARIEKHLYTKGGKLAKKYEDVIELLNNPDRVMRPIYWGYKGERCTMAAPTLKVVCTPSALTTQPATMLHEAAKMDIM